MASVGGPGSPTTATSSWDDSSRITHQGHNAIPSGEHSLQLQRGETWAEAEPALELRNDTEEERLLWPQWVVLDHRQRPPPTGMVRPGSPTKPTTQYQAESMEPAIAEGRDMGRG